MAFIDNLPLGLRLACLFVVGAFVAGQINRGIYRLAYDKRAIGPWSKPHPKAPPRRLLDYLPIIGWFGMRRESSIHGEAFWLRPMLLEFCFAFATAWLYYWTVEQGGLIANPPGKQQVDDLILHCYWLVQICLISLLTVATFIDFDEHTIPDTITMPGTILGLLFAACLPFQGAQLPVAVAKAPGVGLRLEMIPEGNIEPLLVISPWRAGAWPGWLSESWGLAIGIGCFVGWCIALLPILWIGQLGTRKALQFMIAYIVRPRRKTKRPEGARQRSTKPLVLCLLALVVIGPIGITLVWLFSDVVHWKSLLSSLIGMAFGGCLIWGVRIAGTRALKKEAMGFGDVTLMAMIGAFLGWQSTLIVFFLAPLASVFIAGAQLLFTGKHEIAFGPYLSVGTVILLLGWAHIWNVSAANAFVLGWTIPMMVVVFLVLMAAMLLAWRLFKENVLGIKD